MRRSRKDARNYRGEVARREADRRRLGHPGDSRFRVSLGLHGVLALGDPHDILALGNRLGNTDDPAERHAECHHAERER
jgi:hypothetical protein